MNWVKFSDYFDSLMRFVARVNCPDLEDYFSVFITDVESVPSEYRGTVYEKCVMLNWRAKDFEKNYSGSEFSRDHWDELLQDFASYNIRVCRLNSCWKCYLSLPLPEASPRWTDSVLGPVPTRIHPTGRVATNWFYLLETPQKML